MGGGGGGDGEGGSGGDSGCGGGGTCYTVKCNSLFYCFQSERREMNLVKRVRGSAV